MTKYQRITFLIICFLLIEAISVIWLKYLSEKEYKGLNISNEYLKRTTVANLPSTSTIEVYQVDKVTTFTAYTLSVDETDGSPCIGSGNNNLCELRKEMNICASRDLPLDTIIYIEGFGECVIKDRLNKRYKGTNRVDILMKTKKEALNFGKRELNYIIVK